VNDASGSFVHTNGYSAGNNIVMGEDADDGTSAHEVFHALGLEHIFEHKSQSRNGRTYTNAKHCFKEFETKNLMDYTGLQANDRHFIYEWQANIVNGKASPEPATYKPQ
jgi:hypothetical protein